MALGVSKRKKIKTDKKKTITSTNRLFRRTPANWRHFISNRGEGEIVQKRLFLKN